MQPHDAVELARGAILTAGVIAAPVLLAGLVVGLAVGLLQALTQVHEQVVGFVPKLAAVAGVLALTLPWIIGRLVQYAHDLIVNTPGSLGGG